MKSLKTKIVYPAQIIVDAIFNPKTKTTSYVWVKTGPYSKALCGETQEEVSAYLAHIIELYREDKAKHIAKEEALAEKLKELKEK